MQNAHGEIIAYHGTALENFHSILRNGFLNHFNTTALFGEGTYLSSDLSVCMGFNRAGTSWAHSQFGTKLSCVAVCQVVKHPTVKLPGTTTDPDVDRASTIGGEKIPDTYVIVPNNDHIRTRYVFIYQEEHSAAPSRTAARTGVSVLRHLLASALVHRAAHTCQCQASYLLVHVHIRLLTHVHMCACVFVHVWDGGAASIHVLLLPMVCCMTVCASGVAWCAWCGLGVPIPWLESLLHRVVWRVCIAL